MPAYEYECQTCGDHFERRQKMSDPPLDACPACGAGVRRLISGGAGIVAHGTAPAARTSCGMGSACCVPESPCGGGGCCSN